MKMRHPPVKPERRYSCPIKEEIYENCSIDAVIKELRDQGAEEIIFEFADSYHSLYRFYLTAQVPEPEEDYQTRLLVYEKELASYNKWLEKNQVSIAAHEAQEKEKAEVKTHEDLLKEEQRLTKKLQRIKKDLAATEAKLAKKDHDAR